MYHFLYQGRSLCFWCVPNKQTLFAVHLHLIRKKRQNPLIHHPVREMNFKIVCGRGKPNSLKQVYSGFPVELSRWRLRQELYIKGVASYFFSFFLAFFFSNVVFEGKSLQNTYTKHFASQQTCLNWKWSISLRATCSSSCQNHIPH